MSAAPGRPIAGLRALVTGAARGIGLGFVSALLEQGAAEVVAGVRDLDDLPPEWAGDPRIVPIRLDVTSAADIAAAARRCDDIDLLILNAGITCLGPVLEHDMDTARHVMEVNYFGPLALTQALAPRLIERQGGVIFVLSMAAMIPPGPAPLYSASKSAAAMVAEGLRNELAGHGCQVTLCFPGYVDTRMTKFYPHPDRKVSPEDLARTSLDAWSAGVAQLFPDRFSRLVLDHMRRDGARILTDATRVRQEIEAEYRSPPRTG